MKWTTDQFYHPLFTSLVQKNPLSNHTLSNGGLDDDHIATTTAGDYNDDDGDINKVHQCISL